ncbi:mechanosensitive ion channel domain-containing protein [Zeaxanthinibacter enoshimensis]|uniref:Mechanosensitive ion channel-like protein n=1 Tax=Zeaxanthinibacter enoshimensis TaxID=392009 RepID=A0A4R6TMY3_9FLAO|nr:mechanosensitive ion channel domain-containing protein [Zeaxanthinibacter enoshimensis]TDQ31238.1 mechanosensitive ion channel-like protein [Zeaxanthinibacter enoshimensis]
MKELLFTFKNELASTGVILLLVLVLKYGITKTVRKVGRISDIHEIRTRLIIKYLSFGITFLGIVAIIFVWGVNIRDIGLVFSSIFAVIGVALFASWSIISNVTAGVILFFTFPFKIGDRIKIFDKEIDYEGSLLIEDIRAYHIHLRKDNGELMTYPNNLLLQKAVSLIGTYDHSRDGSDAL